MKIITFYLPQFHTFEENDKWWGKGFTEWVNVKNAVPVFDEHQQPKIPYKYNYYNLLDISTLKWQVELAKKYGIYGFCYYHYWFDGKLLMNRPLEMLLENNSIDMPFCICWANENWTRAWASNQKEVLIEQTYGDEEMWIKHFYYLLPFFKDKRYIKIDNTPIMIIYRPKLIPCLLKMLECWKKLALQEGLKGIKFIYQRDIYNHKRDKEAKFFDYGIEYQPGFVRGKQKRTISVIKRKLGNLFVNQLSLPQSQETTIYFDYDDTWKRILKHKPQDDKMIPGAFVNWDNTPRYKEKGSVVVGYTSNKFQDYMEQQLLRTKTVYGKDILFLFAWNEWGEGGYLEPDEEERYARLEAVKAALVNTGNWNEE